MFLKASLYVAHSVFLLSDKGLSAACVQSVLVKRIFLIFRNSSVVVKVGIDPLTKDPSTTLDPVISSGAPSIHAVAPSG